MLKSKANRSSRKIANHVAAVLAGRAVPMTREQIHERAEKRRRHICEAIHAKHPHPGTSVARPTSPLTSVARVHRQHYYRRPALDVGCACEPDKRSDICVHHGTPAGDRR